MSASVGKVKGACASEWFYRGTTSLPVSPHLHARGPGALDKGVRRVEGREKCRREKGSIEPPSGVHTPHGSHRPCVTLILILHHFRFWVTDHPVLGVYELASTFTVDAALSPPHADLIFDLIELNIHL